MRNTLLTIFILFIASNCFSATEDLTTFTEGGSDVAQITSTTTTRITWDNVDGNDDVFSYKDFTADYFGEFDIDFTGRADNNQSLSLVGFFALANNPANNMGELNTNNDGIVVGFKRTGTDGWFITEYETGGANDQSVVAGGSFETRYITVTRSGSTVTLNVYTDSGRTTHATGSPVTVTADTTKYRYMYALMSGGSEGTASNADGYTENLEIVQADSASGDNYPFFWFK